jgi:hypothetical protein
MMSPPPLCLLVNEDLVTSYVESAVNVDRERAQSVPSQADCELFEAEFRRFATFARGHGLRALPARGHSVALYVLTSSAAGASLDQIATAVTAIKHAHDMVGAHLDLMPINAAMEVAVRVNCEDGAI